MAIGGTPVHIATINVSALKMLWLNAKITCDYLKVTCINMITNYKLIIDVNNNSNNDHVNKTYGKVVFDKLLVVFIALEVLQSNSLCKLCTLINCCSFWTINRMYIKACIFGNIMSQWIKWYQISLSNKAEHIFFRKMPKLLENHAKTLV